MSHLLTIQCLWLAFKVMPSVTKAPSLCVLQSLGIGIAWEIVNGSDILELLGETVRESTTGVDPTEDHVGDT